MTGSGVRIRTDYEVKVSYPLVILCTTQCMTINVIDVLHYNQVGECNDLLQDGIKSCKHRTWDKEGAE